MRTLHRRTISGASSETKAHGSRAGATSPGVRALPDINTGYVQEGVPEVNGTCTHAQTHISHLRVHAVSCCCMPEVDGTCTLTQMHSSHLRMHAVSWCCMACCAAFWHSDNFFLLVMPMLSLFSVPALHCRAGYCTSSGNITK